VDTFFQITNALVALSMVTAIPLALYFLPGIVAHGRDLKNTTAIFLLNLFLGWTLVGWVVALCLASMGNAAKREMTY